VIGRGTVAVDERQRELAAILLAHATVTLDPASFLEQLSGRVRVVRRRVDELGRVTQDGGRDHGRAWLRVSLPCAVANPLSVDGHRHRVPHGTILTDV